MEIVYVSALHYFFALVCTDLSSLESCAESFLMTYYFDVLPLHPPPEYFESLTSYLMRLAEVNGISSIDGISALSFPLQDRRITREIADYPPMSFDQLMIAGACNREILRTTTFFHLAVKFGRSTLPQPTSRFLSGCISQYLRYCPICFAEQQVQYYPLFWRFLILTCCYKHKCPLLETCGHCGALIPLFTSPFKLGNCPKCQQNLKLCPVVSITDEVELEIATHFHDDIVFLLNPQLWEVDSSNIIRRVGRRFAHIRRMNQRTTLEVANQIGVTLTVVEGIERGNVQSKGATLQSYIKYAQYLSLSLKEVFSNAIDASDHITATPLPLCPSCQQNHYVTRCGYNRSGSQRYECQHCHHSFTALPKAREVKKFSPKAS
jgi:DNA-binding XRE family transcriptional regulator